MPTRTTRSSTELTGLRAAKRREIEREWPQLSYYYGLSFTELAHMPRWLRRAYVRELPRLRARERLAEIETTLMPHMSHEDQRSIMNRLNRAADLPKPPVSRPKTQEEMIAAAAGAGIGVELVKS